MAKQPVRIEGLDEAENKIADVMAHVRDDQQGVLSKAILQLHRYMAGIVPVDTGRLKNSLHPFVEARQAGIQTNVDYALPVEMRTGYVRRTAEQEGPRVAERVIIEGLQAEIDDIFSS